MKWQFPGDQVEILPSSFDVKKGAQAFLTCLLGFRYFVNYCAVSRSPTIIIWKPAFFGFFSHFWVKCPLAVVNKKRFTGVSDTLAGQKCQSYFSLLFYRAPENTQMFDFSRNCSSLSLCSSRQKSSLSLIIITQRWVILFDFCKNWHTQHEPGFLYAH